MAIALNETDWHELDETALAHGEAIYQGLAAEMQVRLPQQIGVGGEQTIFLRDGLVLDIRDCVLNQDLHLTRQHDGAFPLTSKFFLRGSSRVRTVNSPSVETEYEEVAGYNYLYCLPELMALLHD